MFNLLLCFDCFGWLVLLCDEWNVMNWFGVCVFLLLGVLVWWVMGNVLGMFGVIVGVILLVCVVIMFSCEGKKCGVFVLVMVFFVVIGIGGIGMLVMGSDEGFIWLFMFLVGFFGM